MTASKSKSGAYIKAGIVIVSVLTVIMTIVSIWKFGTIFFLFPIWRWMAHKMTDTTGMDIWLARGIAALLVIPLVYIISLVFSWRKSKRRIGIALLSITTAVICFGMFYISQDIYFSFKTGEAMKYYIITPQGEYKFSSSPGYDPVWGKKYEKVTREVIEEYMSKTGRRTLDRRNSSSYFLTEDEEKILVTQLVDLDLSWRKGIDKLHDIIEILKDSRSDYSEEICEVLLRSAKPRSEDYPKNYNRSYEEPDFFSSGDPWEVDDTIHIISSLVEIGSMKAVPSLLIIYGDGDFKEVRDAAGGAVKKIKRRNGY